MEHITLTVNESPALFILITRSCALCERLTPWDNGNPVRLPGFRYYGCWITRAPLNYLYRCVFKWAYFQCPHWLSSFPRNEAENEKMTDKLQNIFFNGNKIDGLNFKDRGRVFFLELNRKHLWLFLCPYCTWQIEIGHLLNLRAYCRWLNYLEFIAIEISCAACYQLELVTTHPMLRHRRYQTDNWAVPFNTPSSIEK